MRQIEMSSNIWKKNFLNPRLLKLIKMEPERVNSASLWRLIKAKSDSKFKSHGEYICETFFGAEKHQSWFILSNSDIQRSDDLK